MESHDMPKVSVIVPVYNMSKYLRQCLDSLVGQSLRDIQIVCVNDGSTDDSLDIIKEYASRDARIDIINKANSGYGASMNEGIRHARGEYIGVVESDDFASRSMFKKLYTFAARHDCDIVKSNFYEHSSDGDKKIHEFSGFPYSRPFSPAQMQKIVTTIPLIWAAIYRRSMIIDEGMHFNETPGASFQDTSFVYQGWMSAKRVAILRGAYLHYRVDNTASSVKSSSKVYEVCGEFAFTDAFIKEKQEYRSQFIPVLMLRKLHTYQWNHDRIAFEYKEDFLNRMADEFEEAHSKGYLQRALFDSKDWEFVEDLLGSRKALLEKYAGKDLFIQD